MCCLWNRFLLLIWLFSALSLVLHLSITWTSWANRKRPGTWSHCAWIHAEGTQEPVPGHPGKTHTHWQFFSWSVSTWNPVSVTGKSAEVHSQCGSPLFQFPSMLCQCQWKAQHCKASAVAGTRRRAQTCPWSVVCSWPSPSTSACFHVPVHKRKTPTNPRISVQMEFMLLSTSPWVKIHYIHYVQENWYGGRIYVQKEVMKRIF